MNNNFTLTIAIALFFSPFLHASVTEQGAQVLSFYEERDLELFSSLNNTHSGLFGVLDKTTTSYGKNELKKILATPLSDAQEIQQRQRLIQELITNNELFNELDEALSSFKLHERSLNLFWDSRNNEFVEKTLSKFYYSYNFLKSLNDSPLALDIGHILEFGALFGTTIEHCLMEFGIDQVIFGITGGCGHDHHHHHDHQCPMTATQRVIKKVWQTAHWSFHLLSFVEMVNHLKHKGELIDVLHQEMRELSGCIRALNSIENAIKKASPLTKRTDSVAHFFSPINPTELTKLFAITSENEIVQTLLSDDFENSPDNTLSFYSGIGTTLVACAQFNQQKEMFIPSLQSLGKLDAFMAIARWIKAVKSPKTPICFASIVESNDPYISLQDGWNAMLQESAISTNIEFGTDSSIQTSKMLLTGPNKSGKTSLLKTVAFNVILAQTFGIAAASSMQYTPFHKVISYLTVNDDIAAGHSSMSSELLRADNCLKTLLEMAPHHFALVLIDDALFKRTSFKFGQDAAYDFIRALEQLPHAIVLAISHFPRLGLLEGQKDSKFRNYQTNVITKNGKKISTYALKRGSCEQDAIFDLIDSDKSKPEFLNG